VILIYGTSALGYFSTYEGEKSVVDSLWRVIYCWPRIANRSLYERKNTIDDRMTAPSIYVTSSVIAEFIHIREIPMLSIYVHIYTKMFFLVCSIRWRDFSMASTLSHKINRVVRGLREILYLISSRYHMIFYISGLIVILGRFPNYFKELSRREECSLL
jgi:hypothetical protein